MSEDHEHVTEDMEAYKKRLADEHKLLLDRVKEIGFVEMDYARDLWPPAHTGKFYLCGTMYGYTRTDKPKYTLVPLFHARIPVMHELFLRRKTEEFLTIRPRKYGK